MIAHPPCTYLSSSGLHWNKKDIKRATKTILALAFVQRLMNASIYRIAIENPIGCISTQIRKPDQIVQPYQFGHTERKSTCFWIAGLPKLEPTEIVEPDIIIHKSGRTDSRLHYETFKLPKEERRKARSKTFHGIAEAIAAQYTDYLLSL
mgnify:CR=1 FL=1